MNEFDYDVIIVGAGPAGSTTARYIKKYANNAKVLILERRKKVGVPIQCGEGLSKISEWKKLMPADYPLDELFEIPQKVIARDIKYGDVFSPKFTRYRLNHDGWVLYRDRFDQHLAELATKVGVEIRLNTSVKGLEDNHTIKTSNGNLTSNLIVGADGPRSLIAESIGLQTPSKICTLCPCVFCIVKGDFHEDAKRTYFGKRFANGFAWLFPKGETANIGLGSEWKKHRKFLRNILDKFLKDLKISFEDIIFRGGGVIPMGGPIPQTVRDNVLIVGDAAGMVWPSTGGGIGPSMISGRECGIAIANHLTKNASLNEYDHSWKKLIGDTFKKSLNEKNRFLWLTRHDLILEFCLKAIGKKSFSLGGIFP